MRPCPKSTTALPDAVLDKYSPNRNPCFFLAFFMFGKAKLLTQLLSLMLAKGATAEAGYICGLPKAWV